MAELFSWRRIIIALLLFISLTFLITYPLFFMLNKSMSGFQGTDEPSVWYFWWLKYAYVNNLNHADCRYISYPFGQDYAVFDQLYPLWSSVKRVLAINTSHCFSYNMEVVSSFILSGLFAYMLMLLVSADVKAAVFCGIIYTFSPYHFARAWQHIGLTHIQWIPLYVCALLRIKVNWEVKKIICLALALFLAASFDYHYLYFMLIVTSFFWVYYLIVFRRKCKRLTINLISAVVLAGLVIVIILWPFVKIRLLTSQAKSISAWSLYRPFDDLFSQSARPLSYFLPAAVHPVFGKFTEQFIGSSLYGMSFTEHTLYLGWVPLALAFVAFRRWRRKRKEFKKSGTAPFGDSPFYRDDFYIGFFIFLAIAAWLFSQPPWWDIFGFKIYMPSFFMYKILPMFRAYCRFGIVVMLAVAVLAGFGLKFFLERFKSRKTKAVVSAIFCGLVLFEFWNWPPYKVIDLSKVPAVYYWVKEQPKDIVIADYPLDADSPNELYKFFQTVHEKKIINGTIPGTHANKVAQEIRRLSDPKTASILKWMGVKYVVVHKDDYLKTDLIEDKEDMERIPQNPGLKFVKSFPPQECPDPELMCVQKTGPVDVYEVVSKSKEPEVKK